MHLFKNKLSVSFLIFIILFGIFQLLDLNRNLIQLPSNASYEVFSIADQSVADERFLLINIRDNNASDINRLLDTLLSFEPKLICLDLSGCQAVSDSISLLEQYTSEHLFVHKDRIALKNSFDINSDTIRVFKSSGFEQTYEGQIVKIVDPNALSSLNKRNNQFELIHFSGFIPRYLEIGTYQFLEKKFGREFVESKILLVGNLGENTPIYWNYNEVTNPTLTYRTPVLYGPDKDKSNLYGTQISANILSTVLDRSYINQISSIHYLILVLSLVAIHFLLLRKVPIQWYWLIAYILFVAESIGETSLIVFIFARTNYLIDPGYSQYIYVSSFFSIYVYRIVLEKKAYSIA